ncbi:hypothetical protein [Scytonema millei]|uniref:Uncharacterized protein n=1 Tax=Scytonema millei VB511283 TaxID=1245923 RepID=A0A9X5I7A4_9CYAN|nr:hypothetical protein [Scytonema millei]NHC37559.1 hypothetical protein [Scytonema millei VB511283]
MKESNILARSLVLRSHVIIGIDGENGTADRALTYSSSLYRADSRTTRFYYTKRNLCDRSSLETRESKIAYSGASCGILIYINLK